MTPLARCSVEEVSDTNLHVNTRQAASLAMLSSKALGSHELTELSRRPPAG